MSKPKKWHEVYPYGTKTGDEEAKVFRALSRHAKFDWRSTGAIVKATGLSRERVEEIIDKYVNKVKPPLIYPHTSNEDHWCYWERVPEVLKKDERDISKKDKDSRVDKQITGTSMTGTTGVQSQSDSLCDMEETSQCGYPPDDANSLCQRSSGDANLDPHFEMTYEECEALNSQFSLDQGV
jgi:hypothetical protein